MNWKVLRCWVRHECILWVRASASEFGHPPLGSCPSLPSIECAFSCQPRFHSGMCSFCPCCQYYFDTYPVLSLGFWVSQHISLLKLIFFRSSKERFRDQDLASRDRDRRSRYRSPGDRDRKDKPWSYESANGRSEDRRSSEEREAGEIWLAVSAPALELPMRSHTRA